MNWRSTYLTGTGPDNCPVFSVIAKRSYVVSPEKILPCEFPQPLVETDVFANPQNIFNAECIAETDLVPYKPTTDVIITGLACAPRGKQAYSLECKAVIGPLKKTVLVYGERSIEYKLVRGYFFSDPRPFSTMDLGYARAYGGTAPSKSGALFPYYPNPIGRGFAIKGGFEDAAEISVPNLEDPLSPVTADTMIVDRFEAWPEAPKPASFGWTRKEFYPRYTYCGVPPLFLDGAVRIDAAPGSGGENKAPCMDPRFFQGASEGLFGTILRGDEHCALDYFDPDFPQLQFALPGEKPVIVADLGDGPAELVPMLQTVIIDMKERLLSMVWRGSRPIESIEAIEKMDVMVR